MNDLTFLSCIRFSLQLMIAESIFLCSFPRKKLFLQRILCGGCGFFAVLYFIFLLSQNALGAGLFSEIFYYFAVFSLTLVFMGLCFQINGKEILFAGIGGYATQHLAFALTRIVQYLLKLEDSEILSCLWIHGVLYILIPFAGYWLVIKRHQEEGELKEKDIRMLSLAMVTLFTTIVVSLMARSELAGVGNTFLQDFVCHIYALVCCVLILFMLFYIPKENKLHHEQQMLEQMIQLMGEQQQMSKESVEIINRKCHDIKHQLKALASMEDSGERKRYTDEIREAISIYDAVYQTGNSALDFVLREKSVLFQEHLIQFSCIAEGSALSFMDTLDIYALFGNALDNAAESVIKEADEEKRIINMRVEKKAQILHIHVDNYCKDEIQFQDGMPVTSKSDKDFHGFGTKSIRHIAEKYDGEILLQKKKERFVLDVLIPLSE